MTLFRLFASLLAVLATACTSIVCREAPPSSLLASDAPLILVSIDGFRADYLDRGFTPTLAHLGAEGVRAGFMRPSFPSLTFPNHYTLITGLRPDRNGIVANMMEDASIPGQTFRATNREAIGDARWWDGATPLWTTAQRAGLRTATVFWPASEAPVHGAHPDQWLPFDPTMTPDARVDTLLAWLDVPVERRPRFMTLYFDGIDKAGHHYGPGSPEVDAELRRVDAAVSRLLDGLAARGLRERANLVVVSDHGMASTSPERVIRLDDVVPLDDVHVVMWGVLTGLVPKVGSETLVERRLLAPHEHMTCRRKSELPPELHYGRHPRVPPLLCIADHGWIIFSHAIMARKDHFSLGEHGYATDHPDMRAIFMASGPAFAKRRVIAPFDNVDVYPLLARVLGVTPEPNDGDLAEVADALAVPPDAARQTAAARRSTTAL
ncbi:ectonucleotide pyrophosphatase/phosphodiesterase [Dokdonella sp. MW10]|uniref:alkaline phosphatase family protein n=1 Tax=Dokdonella sp. MW10 TaxID=2992926 RepID=UPI003F7EF782